MNTTSHEPAVRLLVRDADETTEALPDEAGTPTCRHVPAILRKRRTDLTGTTRA